MIPLSWKKRSGRKSIVILLFVTVLAAVFFFRRPIAINSIEYLAEQQGLNISCLDFSMNWQLNIKVKQACITLPTGEILVREAIWQPWPNILRIKRINVRHHATNHQVDKKHSRENQTNQIKLPDFLPKIIISSLQIHSSELLKPLYLSVNTIDNNEFHISGDVNASVKILQNTIIGSLVWSVADLTKWVPRAENLVTKNADLFRDVALDEIKIKTHLIFDGKMLSADNSFNIDSRIYVSKCPIDAVIDGNVLVDIEVSTLNIGLDLSQLSSHVSIDHCPLLRDYFAEDDLPQLSLIFEHKVAIDKTQINLPSLHIVDKRNPNRSIVLNELNFKTIGELAFNYNISLKQPIKAKKLTAGMLDFQGNGLFSAEMSTLNTPNIQQPFSWKIIDDNNQLVITDLKMDALLISDLTSEFSFIDLSVNKHEIKGTIHSSVIQVGVVELAKTSSFFSLLVTNFNDVQLSIDNQLSQLDHPDFGIQNISSHIDINIKELETLSFSGDSSVTNLSAQNINFMPIDVTHTGQVSLSNMSISSVHKIHLEHGFLVSLEQQQTHATLQIAKQNIVDLQSTISQFENALVVKEGKLTASIEFTLPLKDEKFFAQGEADFQGVSVKYQDYLINNMTYQTPLTYNSAGLQLAESTLHIDSINVGVAIEQLKANVIAKGSEFWLTQMEGEIFNGQFSLGHLWLDRREQQFNINIQNIDLAELVALQQQPGIKITGRVNGDMPFIMSKQGVRIEDGWVSSLSGGKLTIVDNPSFDSVKVQQPQLVLLENLDFTKLESKVKFTPDGWVFFDFALRGNNPVKKQSVNFNYSHQENIFALLESVRFVKSVENKIEQKITQGGEK